MSGYIGINLIDILTDESLGESVAKNTISQFSCPLNLDVEKFLHHSAIEFARQGIASTYLVMASYKGEYVLCGYYTLANKVFCISKASMPSKKWQRRLSKFGQYDKAIQRYTISAPLIGQLGKNYANGYNELITGDELLKLALDRVSMLQRMVGGKIVYLECEPKDRLIEFYESNGFVNFGSRLLDRDETETISGESLIQLLKYM